VNIKREFPNPRNLLQTTPLEKDLTLDQGGGEEQGIHDPDLILLQVSTQKESHDPLSLA